MKKKKKIWKIRHLRAFKYLCEINSEFFIVNYRNKKLFLFSNVFRSILNDFFFFNLRRYKYVYIVIVFLIIIYAMRLYYTTITIVINDIN